MPGATSAPRIYALWHGRMIPALLALARIGETAPLVAMVDDSPDGALQAQVLAAFGVESLRSCEGGPKALLGLAREIRNGRSAVIAVDGPVGPAFCARSGAVALSAITCAPLVPVGVSCQRQVIVPGTWDRMVLPLPGTIRLRLGGALDPPTDRSLPQRSARLEDLQNCLAALNHTLPRSLRSGADKAL